MARASRSHAASRRTAASPHHGELVSDDPGGAGNPSRVAGPILGAGPGRPGFKVKRLVAAFGGALLIGSAALGHDGATGVVKQRMDEMEQIGRAVKRINDRLKSKRGLSEIARDAEEIRAAASKMPSLFPPGSRDGHSDATPAVWERWPLVAAAEALEME